MNEQQLRAEVNYAALFAPAGSGSALGAIVDAMVEHEAAIDRLEADITWLKARIEEICRNGTGNGVTGQ